MNEIIIASAFFVAWTAFSIVFILRYKRHQTTASADKRSFWNNSYIFDNIPPVFPTLGIFCTALGITSGLAEFNTTDIQSSIPHLLKGLTLAFYATMAGIIGLIIFQKINAIIQKNIDDTPGRPRKQTDELSAISDLTHAIEELQVDNQRQIERLMQSFGTDLESKVSIKLSSLSNELTALQKDTIVHQMSTIEGLAQINATTNTNGLEIADQLIRLRDEQKLTSEKANNNTDEIIKAMSENNKLTSKKFDEFSDLLRQNNTEALVDVMKNATEQFNSQMSDLIDRLVKENFAELNDSVRNLNDWQKQNKDQIATLTQQFEKTTEMFHVSSTTLKEVSINTQALTSNDSKLSQIVKELTRVMIDDGKFQEITGRLVSTIETLASTTESFEETTSKLNDWVKTERNFKEAAQILISKLEEFRDLNGDVWDNYRKEMSKSVSIVKETSGRLADDLDNINAEFYGRLNDTLENLDQCIQRFVPANRI